MPGDPSNHRCLGDDDRSPQEHCFFFWSMGMGLGAFMYVQRSLNESERGGTVWQLEIRLWWLSVLYTTAREHADWFLLLGQIAWMHAWYRSYKLNTQNRSYLALRIQERVRRYSLLLQLFFIKKTACYCTDNNNKCSCSRSRCNGKQKLRNRNPVGQPNKLFFKKKLCN